MAKAKDKPDRPPTDENPFGRFERALKKVIAVPKATLDERERKYQERRKASS